MIQLVEREEYHSEKQSLANGQKIEAEMANDTGTKVFRVHAPERTERRANRTFDGWFVTEEHIQLVASKLREWYENGCTNMSECAMVFSSNKRGPILWNSAPI
jgi:hypothetical protein